METKWPKLSAAISKPDYLEVCITKHFCTADCFTGYMGNEHGPAAETVEENTYYRSIEAVLDELESQLAVKGT